MENNKTELQKKFEEQTPTIKAVGRVEYLQTFVSWLHLQIERCEDQKLLIHDVSGSAFTKEDLKKAYNNGSRHGSVNGMRVARGGEMNVKAFDEWYDEHYR